MKYNTALTKVHKNTDLNIQCGSRKPDDGSLYVIQTAILSHSFNYGRPKDLRIFFVSFVTGLQINI